MATGRLGAAALSAANYTTIYTVPAGTVCTYNVLMVNRGNYPVIVRIAVTTQASTPLDADFIEYDTIIEANGVLERTAIVSNATEKLMVYSSAATVSVRVNGFEEAA